MNSSYINGAWIWTSYISLCANKCQESFCLKTNFLICPQTVILNQRSARFPDQNWKLDADEVLPKVNLTRLLWTNYINIYHPCDCKGYCVVQIDNKKERLTYLQSISYSVVPLLLKNCSNLHLNLKPQTETTPQTVGV